MRPQPPSEKTLAKYGLSKEEWLAILDRQFGVCAVCGKEPSAGRLNVDHDHVRGWKKMKPDLRKTHVRGLLCFWCNKTYVGRSLTLLKAASVVDYLTAHNERMLMVAPGLAK